MKHSGTKLIETERLILRRFTPDDVSAMYKNWASDDEVTKYLTWPTHTSAEVTKMIIDGWVSSYSKDNFYQWAITFKENGDEPIGTISVVRMNEEISETSIGYCIGRPWWRKGITTEALNAVIDFLFDEVDANRIEALHDTNNPNSGKVMKKCGMKFEGILRQSDLNNQGICDASYYSILKSERDSSIDKK